MVKCSLERKAGCPAGPGWANADRKWSPLRTRGLAGEKGSGRGWGMMATQGDGLFAWVTDQELSLRGWKPSKGGGGEPKALGASWMVKTLAGKEQGTKAKATHTWLLFSLLRNLGFCNTGVSSWGLPDIQQKLTGESEVVSPNSQLSFLLQMSFQGPASQAPCRHSYTLG